MNLAQLKDSLERTPVIAAVQENLFQKALMSPAEIVFHLKANLLTVAEQISAAKAAEKHIFIHMDLADGIGKDRTGVEYIKKCGADGIISTRGQIIHHAKECGLLTIQRFFVLDSQGISSISELAEVSNPDMLEIMPGVIAKIIKKFSSGDFPVIAGGLVETKAEVTQALNFGASAVSTGKEELWYI